VSLRACQAVLLSTALALAVTPAPAQQTPAGKDSSELTPARPADNSADKLKLLDATRVSTEDAARRAAEKKAKESGAKESPKKDETQKKQVAPAVSELKPVTNAGGDKQAAVQVPAEGSGKLPLKNIHGSIQGSGGGGLLGTGGDVGASTPSGKTHIDVETERSRSDAAIPH
jgi:hypothetical protein